MLNYRPNILPVIGFSENTSVSNLCRTQRPRDLVFTKELNEHIRPYLQLLIEKQDRVVLPKLLEGISTHLPIDKLYVALTVDTTARSERATYDTSLNEYLQELWLSNALFPEEIQGPLWLASQQLEREQHYPFKTIQWDSFILSPHVLSPAQQLRAFQCLDQRIHEFDQSKRHERLQSPKSQCLTLQQAYNDHAHLVILGDPGSGKTTVARWLAVNMAKAYLNEQKLLLVSRYQVDPQVAEEDLKQQVSFGRIARIPIYIVISAYAQYCEHHQENSSLEAFIEHQYPDHSMTIMNFIHNGYALIILDGLDEAACRELRQRVIDHIHDFMQLYSSETEVRNDRGNRFIITSRIAGNYTSTLNNHFCRVTIEPLTENMVRQFFKRWFHAIEPQLDPLTISGAKAASLTRLVMQDQHLRDLVKTPQLATMIAYVYILNHYQLPQSKISLYDIAIEHFIAIWQSRLSNINPSLSVTKELMQSLLESVAFTMHDHSGSLYESDLRANLAVTLHKVQLDEVIIEKHIHLLLFVISQEVGLLVPDSINTYRFIHRQFQEYLAARHLIVKQPSIEAMVDEFMQKLTDLNWHEPIRLALSYLGQHRTQEWLVLVEQMLSDTSDSNIMPIVTYLLIDILSQEGSYLRLLEPAQRHELITRLLISLSLAYGHQWEIASLAMMQHSQTSFAKWIDSPLEEEIRSALSTLLRHVEIGPRLARLLLDSHYQHPDMIEALVFAFNQPSSSQYDWAIARLLKKQASFFPTDLKSQSLLQQRLATIIASEGFVRSYKTFAILVATLPAYKRNDVISSRRDYQLKASLLSFEKGEREKINTMLRYEWGDDSIYNIAVFLDTKGKIAKETYAEPSLYLPTELYFSSTIFYLVEEAYAQSADVSFIKSALKKLYRSSSDTNIRVECLLVLMSLGKSLAGYEADFSESMRRQLKFSLERLQYHLQDSIYRSHEDYFKDILRIKSLLPANILPVITLAYIQSIHELTGLYFSWKKKVISDELNVNPALRASLILSVIRGENFDYEFNAKSVEIALEPVLNPESLDYLRWQEAVNYIPLILAPGVSNFYWPVNYLPTHPWCLPISESSMSWQSLEMLARLPAEAHCLLVTFVASLPLNKNFDWFSELLTIIIVFIQKDDEIARSLIAKIDTSFTLDDRWLEQLMYRIDKIESPYYRARAQLRLAMSQGNKKDTLFLAALQDTNEISDNSEKAEMRVLLAENAVLVLSLEEARQKISGFLESALESIRCVPDPGQRALLITRLSLLSSNRDLWINEAISYLVSIEDELRRAYHARLLLPIWKTLSNATTQSLIAHLYSSFQDSVFLSFAEKYLSSIIEIPTKILSLEEKIFIYEHWVALLVASQAHDCQQDYGFSLSIEESWAKLMIEGNEDILIQLLANMKGNGFVLNIAAGLAIEQLFHQHQDSLLDCVLPYVKQASQDMIPLLAKWLLAENRQQQLLAVLLLSEMYQQLFTSYIAQFIELLSSPYDEWRQRASFLLHRNLKRQNTPFLKLSILGKKAFLELARARVDAQRYPRSVRVEVRWLGHFLIHDDPLLMQYSINQLKINALDAIKAEQYQSAITFCDFISFSVFEVILDQYATVNDSTQFALFELMQRANKSFQNSYEYAGDSRKQRARFFQLFKQTNNALFEAKQQRVSYGEGVAQIISAIETTSQQESSSKYAAIISYWKEKCLMPLSSLKHLSETHLFEKIMSFFFQVNKMVDIESFQVEYQTSAENFVKKSLPIRTLLELIQVLLQETEDYFLLEMALGISLYVAKQLPWQFRKMISLMIKEDVRLLQGLLTIMSAQSSAHSLRANAIQLFEFIPLCSETLHAIEYGIRDVNDVRALTLKMVHVLSDSQQVNVELVSYLITQIENKSAILSYTAIHCLRSIAQSELTPRQVKQHIMLSLKAVGEHLLAKRYVNVEHFTRPIAHIPSLAQLIVQAMMTIAYLPDYSYDYQQKMKKLQDEANLAAAHLGDADALVSYLRQNPAMTWKSEHISKLICLAEERKHYLIIDALLNEKNLKNLMVFHLEKSTENQMEFLMEFVAKKDCAYLLKQLFKRHPMAVLACIEKEGLFHCAVKENSLAVCEVMLESQIVDVNAKNALGRTALHVATMNNRVEICQLLLVYGVSIHAVNSEGKPVFDIAKSNAEIHALLKNYKESLDKVCGLHSPETLLYFAVEKGYEVMCRCLLNKAVDLNFRNNEEQTLLMIAIGKNHENIFQLLLEKGCLVNAVDIRKDTALHYAAFKGSLLACRLLIQHGADPNARGIRNAIPLHNACWNGHLNCARYLASHTDDINSLADEGATPLHLAVIDGTCLELVTMLVDQGADLNYKLQNIGIGSLAYLRGLDKQIDYFKTKGQALIHAEINRISPSYYLLKDPEVKTFLQRLHNLGVDLSFACENGETWLTFALKFELANAVLQLTSEFWVNPRTPNRAGEMPFDIACATKDASIIHLMTQYIDKVSPGVNVIIKKASFFVSDAGFFMNHSYSRTADHSFLKARK
ncbi:MAG: ankyrin repeat domain-containing protein [Saprospiraceae bacterium]|nr:ankyrin repeat domain-containing protein [Saprospiraceae bacterium]